MTFGVLILGGHKAECLVLIFRKFWQENLNRLGSLGDIDADRSTLQRSLNERVRMKFGFHWLGFVTSDSR